MRNPLNCLGLALALLFGIASAAWADDITVCSKTVRSNCSEDDCKSNLIKDDTPWEECTYLVQEHIHVRRGAKLTLDPGVTLKFVNLGISLQVEGKLIARGTEEKPITFTSGQTTPAPGNWGGILFTKTAVGASFKKEEYVRGSILEHCMVEFAGEGTSEAAIWAKSSRAPFVSHSTIQKNKTSGIRFEGTQFARIIENTISENDRDGIEFYVGTATLSKNKILKNKRRGITVGGTATLSGNTISGNTGIGFYLTMGKATLSDNTVGKVTLEDNSTILGNSGGGVFINSGKATLSSNIISGNGKGNSGDGVTISKTIVSGITVAGTATLKSNTISGNQGSGINIVGKATVSDHNDISENGNSGINITGTATIRENQIHDNTATNNTDGKGGGILANSTKVTLNKNDILGNSPRELWNENLIGSPNFDARHNWWGSTGETEIQGGIWDQTDDLGLGVVTWQPSLTAPVFPTPPSSAP